jgi:hypothetical protein
MQALRIDPVENPDWDYARNKHVLIKTPLAEFSASAFTAPVKIGETNFYGANRDYSWQGLLAGPIEGILYKVLDAVYFSIPEASLRPKEVLVSVDRCTYRYTSERNEEISFVIALRSVAGEILLEASTARPCRFMIMLDSRPAQSWDEGTYVVQPMGTMLAIKPSAIGFHMVVEGFKQIEPVKLDLDWTYKLGDGFRRIDEGLVRFVKHQRRIHVPAIFFCPSGLLRVRIPVPLRIPADTRQAIDFDQLKIGSGPVADAIRLRLETLSSYSIPIDETWFPEAGSWWFRKAWTRDALEGLRWNIRTYLKIFRWKSRVNSLVSYLIDMLRSLRGLPISIGSDEFASDAPPQLLNVSCMAADILKSHELLSKSVGAAQFVAEEFLEGAEVSKTILRDSILISPPNSSWIDSVVSQEGKRWPARLPASWAEHIVSPFLSEFGLVEVNALYIEALARLQAACWEFGVKTPSPVQELSSVLREGFVRYFKTQEMPPLTVAPSYGLVDDTAGSPAVLAVSVLRGLMYEKELDRIWRKVSDVLLVHRRPVILKNGWLPFGVVVRALEKVPYLGDQEYHGPTIWPRDTPYLLALMEHVGQSVEGLLINNLDHMIAEGAVGYCSELFSLPVGGESITRSESENPVPVKNPAQYWSHWCDPYLEHLPRLLADEEPRETRSAETAERPSR